MMHRRQFLATSAAVLAAPAIARGAASQVLKFVPQADLAVLDPVWTTTYQSRDLIDFQTLGFSKTSDQWTLGAIRMYVMQSPRNSSAEVVFMVGIGITLSLLASLTVYGIVRAIGWVIGRSTTS